LNGPYRYGVARTGDAARPSPYSITPTVQHLIELQMHEAGVIYRAAESSQRFYTRVIAGATLSVLAVNVVVALQKRN
jgi:hypothetical protein